MPISNRLQTWQRAFYVLIAVYGAVILLTFSQYGITSDEVLRASYGRDIVGWYRSFFENRSVFGYGDTYLYGGVFDMVASLAGQISGFDPYDTRHLCNALVGLLGIIAAYCLGDLLGGSRAGFLAALFLVLTPRYYGHGFNNGKDIPFAVFYLWSLYYLLRGAGSLPHLPRDLIWKIGLAIGLTMGVRASGGVLLAYLALFYGLRQIYDRRVKDLILGMVAIGAIAYGTMFLFWPWLQIHPFSGLWDGIRTFASFPVVRYSFFEGQYVGSDAIPWYYAPKWLVLSLPEFVIAGLVLMAVGDRRSFWTLRGFQVGMLAFGGLFPLGYAIVAGTPLYDGIRHLLFVVPPLVVLSAVGVDLAFRFLSGFFKRGLVVLVAGMLVMTCWETVWLHPNQVMYFNRFFAGGIEQASLRYETDYWNHSYKQGLRWIEAFYDRDLPGRKWKIGSFYSNILYMLDQERFEYEAVPEHADFYMGTTQFDEHKRVPGKVVHTIQAKGVPLLYIIRPDSVYREDRFFAESPYLYIRLGDFYRETGSWDAALEAYQKTMDMVAEDPRNVPISPPTLHLKMGNIHLVQKRYQAALKHYKHLADQSPAQGVIFNNIGMYFAKERRYEAAVEWLRKAVAVSPDYFGAQVNLGDVCETIDDRTGALEAYGQAVRIRPGDAGIWTQMGRLCYELGRFGEAVGHYQEVVAIRPDSSLAHYNLGIALANTKDYEAAVRSLLRATQLRPDYAKAYQNLGLVRMYQKRHEQAVEAYQQAIHIQPDRADLYNLLGKAHMVLAQYPPAVEAFRQALEIDPDHGEAAQNRQEAMASLKRD